MQEYIDTEGIEEPTLEETIKAIKNLKNNKSPGKDSILAECIKNGGIILFEAIDQLIITIWREENIPDDWKVSIIIPIHKKGDKAICGNYRGISLINPRFEIQV